MVSHLRFVATRDITLGDLDLVRDAMRAKGHACRHLARCGGGLELVDDIDRLDDPTYIGSNVRFNWRWSNVSVHVDANSEFEGDKQGVLFEVSDDVPWYALENQFSVRIKHERTTWTETQLNDLKECMQKELGLKSDVVADRVYAENSNYDETDEPSVDRPFLDTDTDDDIRIFLRMDPWKTFELYAVKPRFPDGKCHPRFKFETPLSFCCWKCKASRETCEFTEQCPWRILNGYADGEPRACSHCANYLLKPPRSNSAHGSFKKKQKV